MFIRTASERDLAAVRALLVETWHATYDDLYGPERVTQITDEWHSLAKLKANLERPRSEFLVADDGKMLGGMAYARAGDDGKIVTIHQLYVRPASQRLGIGRMLLAEIEDSFPEAKTLHLEVVEDNHRAVAFYRANGFVIADRQEDKTTHASGLVIFNCEKQLG